MRGWRGVLKFHERRYAFARRRGTRDREYEHRYFTRSSGAHARLATGDFGAKTRAHRGLISRLRTFSCFLEISLLRSLCPAILNRLTKMYARAIQPGTMGSKWIDYLVADRFVAPPELAAHYTESLVYFPDSYQINYYPSRDLPPDLQGRLRSERSRGAIRSITKEALQDDASDSGAWLERFRELPTSVVLDDGSLPRAAHGLASDVVFCNFNKIQKFDRTSFALWLAILRRVPRSVLWLLKPSTRHEVRTVQYNLEAEARSMGIHVSRIVWAPRVPKLAHLARHRHATLFLDTLIYNAHSTASDALRGGLPVITTPKQPFAGRVAAALLRAVGLPELIASDVREYEDLAVRLARSPHLIDGLRRRLRDAGELPLFDELQYRKHFERAMTLMWESKHAGQSGHVIVAPRSSRVEGA